MTKEQIDALFERLNEKPKHPVKPTSDWQVTEYEFALYEWRDKREGFRQAMGMLEWFDTAMIDGTAVDLYRIREDRNG